MTTTIILVVALFVLQVLDAYTTIKIDKIDGIENNNEDNKIMRWLFEQFGREAVLIVKIIVVPIVGYWLALNGYEWMTAALVAWYGWIVFGYNWRSMPK